MRNTYLFSNFTVGSSSTTPVLVSLLFSSVTAAVTAIFCRVFTPESEHLDTTFCVVSPADLAAWIKQKACETSPKILS